jgi:hypothetical protein
MRPILPHKRTLMPLRMHASAARYIQRVTALPSASVLVRTWFGDDSAWVSLVFDVETPNDEGFLANVVPVNDRAFEG